MLRRKTGKVYTIILVGVLSASLLISSVFQASAETITANFLYQKSSIETSEVVWTLQYNKYTNVVVSTEYETGTTAGAMRTLDVDVYYPLYMYFANDQWINGYLMGNIKLTLNGRINGGTSKNLLSTECSFEVEYIPNDLDDGTFYSCAYINSSSTSEINTRIYAVAHNFGAYGSRALQFGTFIVHCHFSHVDLENVTYTTTAAYTDVATTMGNSYGYMTNQGLARTIVEALNSTYNNGTFADFIQDIHAYLYGIDYNGYNIAQLLLDIKTIDQQTYNLIAANHSAVMSMLGSLNTNLLNFHDATIDDLDTIIAYLDDIEKGDLVEASEVNSEMESMAENMSDAAESLSLSMPDMDNDFNDLNDTFTNSDFRNSANGIYNWLRQPLVIEILVTIFMFGMVRFLFFGKGKD